MKRLFFALMVCACILQTWAVPAKRISFTVAQPDGTELTLTQRGDEHFHYLMTEDGLVVKPYGNGYYYADVADGKIVATKHLAHAREERSGAEKEFVALLPTVAQLHDVAMRSDDVAQRVRASRAAQKAAEVPTKGEVHVPVLLVQYTDVKFSSSDPAAAFEGHINGDDYKAEGGYGSVKEYFEDQSEGHFLPQFEIIGPLTLSHEMKYYGENDKESDSDMRPREMVQEACRLAAQKTSFSKFDNNKDGYVDIVYVIYAGYGEASNVNVLQNTIWPHQWQLETPLSIDGVKISRYACNNELDGYQGEVLDGIGTFCHEFSHCLGLPDFYDTGDQGAFGMNAWSLMDYGCYNNNGHTPCGYTGYEKDFLGWKPLVELSTPKNVSLQAMSEGGVAYKIVNEANPNEFYVVENHQRTRWDQFAPAEGMLVIHVDYLASAWQNNNLNNVPSHQRMTIIPADNKLTANTLSGDTYPGTSGNTSLTSSSKPAAQVYKGEYMEKDITNISKDGRIVSFSFMKGALVPPVLDEVVEVSQTGFTLTWGAVEEVEEYEVRLDLLEENPYLLDEDFDEVKKNNSDIGGSLDIYTSQPGWYGQGIYGLDGAIRIGSTTSIGALISPTFSCDSSGVTLLFTVKKSEPTDKNPFMVIGIGDQAWGNGLFGGTLSVESEEWVTYVAAIDTIGENTFLYIDTRDNDETAEKETTRIDLDAVYVLPGDRREELTDDASGANIRAHATKVLLPAQCKHLEMQGNAQRIRRVEEAESDSTTEESAEEKRYLVKTVFTGRTAENRYVFDNLEGGLYRCSVRSVKDGVFSHYSKAVEVEVVDSLLPKTDTIPYIYIDKDSMYMVSVDSAALYYTTDGTLPTAYSQRYVAPIPLNRKVNVRVIARRPGHRSSDIVEKSNWFVHDGAVYRILSSVNPQVVLTDAVDGNGTSYYSGHYRFGDSVYSDSVAYVLRGIDTGAFSYATSLRSVVLETDSLCSVGDSLFHGCTSLKAVVWNGNQPLAPTAFDEKSYTHLLVYLPETMEFEHPLIESGHMALIKDGQCSSLTLHDLKPFYCPIPFTVGHVEYKHFYAQSTGLGSSAGWETLALPFDVARIRHEGKGDIAPFGVDATYNFWLAEPADGGFDPTIAIRANKPYIIAMPNHTAYGSDLLNGNVVFSADNVLIHATDELAPYHGTEYSMIPSFDEIKRCDSVYALNVSLKFDKYAAGSVFAPNRKDVMPFSAYMVPAEKNQGAPMFRIQMRPEAEDVVYNLSVTVAGGIVYVTLPEDRAITVYDMVGRKVCVIDGMEGVNEISYLPQGMYMIEKTKVYVKR